MNILTVCATVILAVVLLLSLKQLKSSFSIPLAIILGLLLTQQALETINGEISFFNNIFSTALPAEASTALLKVFGVSIVAETTSDICRDAGENTLSSKIEMIGKIEILIICIPLIKKILEITKELML